MLCPKDMVQMHQADKVGGGESSDESYVTWELKVCPTCGQYIAESYAAIKLPPERIKELKEKGLHLSVEVKIKK